MILVTGGTGFIGSALVWQLNEAGIKDIIIADKFGTNEKWLNLAKRDYYDFVDRDNLFDWLEANKNKIDVIVHLGACSATTEKDMDFLLRNNYEYTKKLWDFSVTNHVKFIYASSAATYGDGKSGYSDLEDKTSSLLPLNKYGYSKHLFDLWALKQDYTPHQWAGFKFFNVYGPNEYHKGKMASVVFHAYNQLLAEGKVKLFKSHNPNYADGGQLRDFVYIKDVTEVILHFINNDFESGIYNLGTGKARSFKDLAENTIKSSKKNSAVEYIDMPIEIRDKYQYFTEADMSKLKKSGYKKTFRTLEEGIKDYIKNYLTKEDKYL